MADGYRESTESWADVLRGLRDRGLSAPTLAVGDGALGFWGAVRDVFDGKVAEQRCWVHKTANVLDALPKRLHPEAKPAIHRIYLAQCRADAVDAVQTFADTYKNHPKAVEKITGSLDNLLAFYDFPAEHGKHLRSTNAIESTFATVRLRTKVTKGAGSRKAALAMAYKLVDAAQDRWRRIDGHHLVPLVRARSRLHRRPPTRKEPDRPSQPRGRRRLTCPPSTRFANISSRSDGACSDSSSRLPEESLHGLSGRLTWVARDSTVQSLGDSANHRKRLLVEEFPDHADSVASIPNGQRRRNLDYQSPATIYHALTVR